ncbi:MAG: homoserine O-succinyltransferase [Rhodospirillales bacterium RIFCSPLOWO2_12_FULL_58_28]|nr:MAG: homoserine O-succinyltransferase [Rhodospirillales bacterium RIFCSPLOWO2_02_FULL_58_16]OHC79023.1 MAG: homoserine O-succinyltransferase [Rhodospirillales bacterium RIFCSPLOWO2_12_FULL_58_28]
MAATSDRKQSSRKKVCNYRERMRARGLRPVQIWVPDTRTANFAKEAHRQSLAVAKSACERKDQAFIDAVTDHDKA